MSSQTSFSGKKFQSMLLTASVAVLAQIASQLIDKILAGRLLGEQALAAVTLFTPLFSVVFFASTCIAFGSAVCYTIYIARFRPFRASEFFGQGIILALIVGAVLCLSFLFGREIYLAQCGIDGKILEYAREFGGVFPFVALVTPLYLVLNELIYADGDEGVTNLGHVVLVLGNIFLSCIFCDCFGMVGIVYGTVLSTLLAMGVLMLHFFRKRNSLRFKFHIKWRDSLAVGRYSAVEACDFLFLSILFGILNHFVVNRFGADHLVVLSVLSDVIELSVIFGGVWQAAEPIVNVYRGEENPLAVHSMMKRVNGALLVECLMVGGLLFWLAPEVVRLFRIQTVDLAAWTKHAIRCVCFGIPGIAFLKVYASYHLHENPFFSLMMVFMYTLACPVLMIYALCGFLGESFLWFGLSLSSYVAFGMSVVIFCIVYGWEQFPLLLEFAGHRFFFMREMYLTKENLMKLRDDVERFADVQGFPRATKVKLMLLIEEMGMLSIEMNKDRVLLGELTLNSLEDDVVAIFKDDGEIMDLTDLELHVSDLRSYLVSSFMANQKQKYYVQTVSFNRHVFRFPIQTVSSEGRVAHG